MCKNEKDKTTEVPGPNVDLDDPGDRALAVANQFYLMVERGKMTEEEAVARIREIIEEEEELN